ncbi:MAG: type II toxin-antitoxin system PemK/MazF family toxin [Pyrinomonadaceae bacterium]
MKRGDVFVAELVPRSGSEQSGRRPVIIVSQDGFNLTPNWRSIIVVPLSTSLNQARRGPTAIPIDAGDGGLSQQSVALCHQVTTLDRRKISNFLGELSLRKMTEIENGLKAAMDIPD